MPKASFPLFAPAHPELVQQLDEFYTNDDDLTFDLDPIYDSNFLSSLNMKAQNHQSQLSALNSLLNFSTDCGTGNLGQPEINSNQHKDFNAVSWAAIGQNFSSNSLGTEEEEDKKRDKKNTKYAKGKQSRNASIKQKADQVKGSQQKKYNIKKTKKQSISEAEESITSSSTANQQTLLQSFFGNLLPPTVGSSSIEQHMPNLVGTNPGNIGAAFQPMPLLNFNAPSFSNNTISDTNNSMILSDKNNMTTIDTEKSSKKRSIGSVKSSAKSTKKVGGRRKSEEQMERRRERNRILARRTRLRKKFYFESLQKQVLDLKQQNTQLRHLVQKTMKEKAPEVLGKCSAVSEIPLVVRESMGEGDELNRDGTSRLSSGNMSLIKAFQSAQQSFIVTDPSLPDNPIVFATEGFVKLTGYRLDQVLGRNCRFLQGPETDKKSVEKIAKALKDGVDTSTCLLNYKADGSTFWNHFFIAPLRDLNNNVVYYVGAQCAVEKAIDYDMVKLATTIEDADDMLVEYPSPSLSPGGGSHGTKALDDLASDFVDDEEQDNETQIIELTQAHSSESKVCDEPETSGKDSIDEKDEIDSETKLSSIDSVLEVQKTLVNPRESII